MVVHSRILTCPRRSSIAHHITLKGVPGTCGCVSLGQHYRLNPLLNPIHAPSPFLTVPVHCRFRVAELFSVHQLTHCVYLKLMKRKGGDGTWSGELRIDATHFIRDRLKNSNEVCYIRWCDCQEQLLNIHKPIADEKGFICKDMLIRKHWRQLYGL